MTDDNNDTINKQRIHPHPPLFTNTCIHQHHQLVKLNIKKTPRLFHFLTTRIISPANEHQTDYPRPYHHTGHPTTDPSPRNRKPISSLILAKENQKHLRSSQPKHEFSPVHACATAKRHNANPTCSASIPNNGKPPPHLNPPGRGQTKTPH